MWTSGTWREKKQGPEEGKGGEGCVRRRTHMRGVYLLSAHLSALPFCPVDHSQLASSRGWIINDERA